MSNTLIFAMSTIGSLKLEHFYRLFRHVYLPASIESEELIDVDMRRQYIRGLDSLGYCEFDFDNRVVYICEPALVLLPDFGLPKAVLVGARTPGLLNEIKKAVQKRRKKSVLNHVTHSGENAAIPNTITIKSTDKSVIRDIAAQAGVVCDISSPAAWRLAVFSATLEQILEELQFDERAEPGWDKRSFIIKRLMFSSHSVGEEVNRITEYRHPVTKQLHHWIWNNGAAAEVSRDWGRFAALATSICNILMFDKQRFELAVPVTVPLPRLLARAAVLCSGIPPHRAISCRKKVGDIPPDHPYQVFSGVPPEIAKLIATKLNQDLLYTHFAVPNNGVLYA